MQVGQLVGGVDKGAGGARPGVEDAADLGDRAGLVRPLGDDEEAEEALAEVGAAQGEEALAVVVVGSFF